jgi:hypothetical protein
LIAAADAVNAAKAAGVTVTPGADGRLVLKAATRPPDSVVAALPERGCLLHEAIYEVEQAYYPHRLFA